jgi:hypothetical protein
MLACDLERRFFSDEKRNDFLPPKACVGEPFGVFDLLLEALAAVMAVTVAAAAAATAPPANSDRLSLDVAD